MSIAASLTHLKRSQNNVGLQIQRLEQARDALYASPQADQNSQEFRDQLASVNLLMAEMISQKMKLQREEEHLRLQRQIETQEKQASKEEKTMERYENHAKASEERRLRLAREHQRRVKAAADEHENRRQKALDAAESNLRHRLTEVVEKMRKDEERIDKFITQDEQRKQELKSLAHKKMLEPRRAAETPQPTQKAKVSTYDAMREESQAGKRAQSLRSFNSIRSDPKRTSPPRVSATPPVHFQSAAFVRLTKLPERQTIEVGATRDKQRQEKLEQYQRHQSMNVKNLLTTHRQRSERFTASSNQAFAEREEARLQRQEKNRIKEQRLRLLQQAQQTVVAREAERNREHREEVLHRATHPPPPPDRWSHRANAIISSICSDLVGIQRMQHATLEQGFEAL
jgi:hypothetical protein